MEKKYKLYLLLHNIQKPKNYGMILRSAAAFGVEKVFLINKSQEKMKSSKIMKQFGLFFGSQGTTCLLKYHVFSSIKQAKEYFNENNIDIVGIEIGKNSKDVRSEPFNKDTVIIPGNEGQGLNQPLKEICDFLVYIPQFTSKTASLNVSVATSIVMNYFTKWAEYEENVVTGEKFQETRDQKTNFLDFKFEDDIKKENDIKLKDDTKKENKE